MAEKRRKKSNYMRQKDNRLEDHLKAVDDDLRNLFEMCSEIIDSELTGPTGGTGDTGPTGP